MVWDSCLVRCYRGSDNALNGCINDAKCMCVPSSRLVVLPVPQLPVSQRTVATAADPLSQFYLDTCRLLCVTLCMLSCGLKERPLTMPPSRRLCPTKQDLQELRASLGHYFP